jgi:DNA-binding IclR family transcriptional regulator
VTIAKLGPQKFVLQTCDPSCRDHCLEASADGFAIVEEELELGLRLIALPINDRISWMLSQLTLASFSATEQD